MGWNAVKFVLMKFTIGIQSLGLMQSFTTRELVARRTSGNAQPKLNVGDMCLIPIPTFSDAFYKVISNPA